MISKFKNVFMLASYTDDGELGVGATIVNEFFIDNSNNRIDQSSIIGIGCQIEYSVESASL